MFLSIKYIDNGSKCQVCLFGETQNHQSSQDIGTDKFDVGENN